MNPTIEDFRKFFADTPELKEWTEEILVKDLEDVPNMRKLIEEDDSHAKAYLYAALRSKLVLTVREKQTLVRKVKELEAELDNAESRERETYLRG